MLIIPVPRLRGALVAYFGAFASGDHLLELFCTCDRGLYILTEVETVRHHGMSREAFLAAFPGRRPTPMDLSDRVDQRPHEVTTTADRHQALTLLLTRARQRFAGSPSFCLEHVGTGERPGSKPAPALSTDLVDQALPQHPLLWQVGHPLDQLPARLHRLAQAAPPDPLPQQPQRSQRSQRPHRHRRRAS